jgi:hypothetical protein
MRRLAAEDAAASHVCLAEGFTHSSGAASCAAGKGLGLLDGRPDWRLHVCAQDEVLIAGFGRRGHAVGDIPGVRFKVGVRW